MLPLVFVASVIIWLLFCKIVFKFVDMDYRKRGRLSALAIALECAVFGLHAQLFTLSYCWDSFASGTFTFSNWLDHWPDRSSNSTSFVLGISVAAAGAVILVAAFGVFGSPQRILGSKVNELKTSGIYRWTRNPQIVGYGLLVLSVPLVWHSIYAPVVAVVYWFGAHMMVLAEEGNLRRTFGDTYEEYCRLTPRYLGRAKRKT